ncbi:AbrB/MazE/SpoVT family DNA-binding domain-containing protein [Nitrosospira sp. Nsp18]|uniref:AbrB/MazE/SpoVT family DNA-binding domain-containing protein n=1 Tax=Nitrosospira sp. Nsp18 TaxID=1855334 RepID=UPI001C408FFE|nr:AbrB/MazE/SpoVT family DNA-binding domain-containing protein [Nitrosospira sp. Nsp18]
MANIASLPFIHHHVAAMPDVHLGIGAAMGSVIAPTRPFFLRHWVSIAMGTRSSVAWSEIRMCLLTESYDILYKMYIYKESIMQVSKWGNSLAIRLPASVVEALELHEGDDIEVVIADERVFQVKKKPGNDAFLMRLREFRGKLPVDFKFDRDQANARS